MRNNIVGYRGERAEIAILATLPRTGDAVLTEERAGRDGEDRIAYMVLATLVIGVRSQLPGRSSPALTLVRT